jgi:hypothetical protein
VWPKIAREVISQGLDAELLVQVTFERFSGSTPPSPLVLIDRDSILHYHQRSPIEKLRDAIRASQLQVKLAALELRQETTLTEDEIWRWVLVDRQLGLRPAHRFCLAMEAGQLDIAEEWREAALLDYLQNRQAYDAILEARIPASLREEASRLRQAVSEQVNPS